MRQALRHRDFRLLFTGQVVSAIGDQLFPVAVTVQVLDVSQILARSLKAPAAPVAAVATASEEPSV